MYSILFRKFKVIVTFFLYQISDIFLINKDFTVCIPVIIVLIFNIIIS